VTAPKISPYAYNSLREYLKARDGVEVETVECPMCRGSTKAPECEECSGEGEIPRPGLWGRTNMVTCPSCRGDSNCPECEGYGDVRPE
jgi:DnaJ-class molecular chaperone